MKKINFLLIGILLIVFIFGSCTIVVNRWAIDWDKADSGGSTDTLIIHNQTNETIDSIKYYIGDLPPSNWSNVNTVLNTTISPNFNGSFSLGLAGGNIPCRPNETVWIRVGAENAWNSSKLYASDGFTYNSTIGGNRWNATVYKE